MLKHLIIPTEKNNQTPHLLHRTAFIIYVVIILAFNTVLTQLGYTSLKADITIDELVQEHNKERRLNGLGELKYNSILSKSASAKAAVMLQEDCWSHYCPEGKSPWDFFDDEGYNYQFAGENLAEGFSSVSNVINAWMNSPTHRENMLNPNFDEIGFGFATGNFQGKENNTIITVHFGKAYPAIVNDISVSDTFPNNPLDKNSDHYITINNLKDNQVISDDYLELSGTVNPSNSEIFVNINDEPNGRINANGASYTYRTSNIKDGQYTIQSSIQNKEVKSDKIKIYYDAAMPEIYPDSVVIKVIDSNYFFIEFQTSPDVNSVIVGTNDYQAVNEENSNWSIRLNISEISEKEVLNFTLSDRSFNKIDFHLNVSDILFALEKPDQTKIQPVIKEIGAKFIDDIKTSGIKSIASIGFVVYITVLLLIDFIVLLKSNNLTKTARKSHLQFSIFILLLIALNIGGISGQVLKGIQV